MAHLDSLPDPAIRTIFAHLGLLDALNLCRTCKHLADIGKPSLRRSLACAHCGGEVCAVAAAAVAGDATVSRVFSVYLDDGNAMCVGEPDSLSANVNFEEERECSSRALSHQFALRFGAENLGLRERVARCGGCGLYLGSQIAQVKSFRAGHDLDISSWRLGIVLGEVFMVRKYLTVNPPTATSQDPRLPGPTWGERVPSRVFVCGRNLPNSEQRCGLPFFTDGDVLSKDHGWSLSALSTASNSSEGAGTEIQGAVENAWYVNHAATGSLVDGKPREMELAQGNMEVRDTSCGRCGSLVGWKFLRCMEGGKNDNFCGRRGFVRNRLHEVEMVEERWMKQLLWPPKPM